MYKTKLNRAKFTDSLMHSLRIIVGVVVSVLIANAIGIEFASSTAIVTLLGIQSTRKDTWITALKRLVSFGFTVLVAYGFHKIAGTGIVAFSLSITFIVLFSVFAGWGNTISINIVVAVHLFLKGEPFTSALIANETLRVAVGVAIALLVNAGIPDREKEFMLCRDRIESGISELLKSIAVMLRTDGETAAVNDRLLALDSDLEIGESFAAHYDNSKLLPHSDYYLRYMSMRNSEIALLKNIIERASICEKNADGNAATAEYMHHIAANVAVESSLEDNRVQLDALRNELNELTLPTDRREFDRQSALFSIADDLNEMVQLKESFIASLSKSQIKRYWNREL